MTEFYFDLYEKLYQTGYHNDPNLSHFEHISPYIEELTEGKKDVKILDVGCSHGYAVKKLQDLGYDAWGIDVSHTAIQYCQYRKLTTCYLASATNTPFKNNFFDFIISTDTLEHLLPQDIPDLTKELYRIVKNKCLLSIAYDAEGNKTPLQNVKRVFNQYHELSSLHTTLMEPKDWDNHFITAGFNKVKEIECEPFLYDVIYVKV